MPSKRKSGAVAASTSAKRGKAENPKGAPAEVEEQQQQQLNIHVNERSNDSDEALRKDGAPSTNARADDGSDEESESRFVGVPIPNEEARQKWPKRYLGLGKKKTVVSSNKEGDDDIMQAKCHFSKAQVDGALYDIGDDAYVKAGEGEDNYICKIVEFFEAVDGSKYFCAQWYYRARDTVIKQLSNLIDEKRVFFSEIRDDNPLECLVEKLNIARVPLDINLDAKRAAIPHCDYYCDTLYLLPYSTFKHLPIDHKVDGCETSSTISSDDVEMASSTCEGNSKDITQKNNKGEATLLDMYSGCGAMSTGLCLGASLSGLNLVTRWAVDMNEHACNSLKQNHPETEVRNESAEDFLLLLKEWQKLCVQFHLIESDGQQLPYADLFGVDDGNEEENSEDDDGGSDGEVFDVEKVLAICYGDPKEKGDKALYFKVSWKGYGPDENTWEPIDGLCNCCEKLKEFIIESHRSKILPLPGDVDVICGGPPCQGISGFNRFRDKDNPLADVKNKQLLVFMEVVEFLKPRFVLMENVVDLVKFSNGFLGRYALGRLVQLNYQTRLGMMAAGAYGLPQFRMRCFLWGARPSEKLPQYPLPTHDVVVRGVIPIEFEMHTVAYDEGHAYELQKKLLLEDAISDLPPVGTYDGRDEMPYEKAPQTDFQRFIRSSEKEMMGITDNSVDLGRPLFDHRPLELNLDDYERVCRIPKIKGANFRDLPGVRVRPDNKVEWDPDVARLYLDSGKPLVPDYAMTFVNGSSSKPFARVWWDETVPTVVTRAEPHNQAILHPEQDRVLTVRENARLQGFPDYYKLSGPIKERYIQVGNAVAVPVARALGCALAEAFQKSASEDPLFRLPDKFVNKSEQHSSASSENDE
ncbi:DNA (cytosine-5)-methyltransferase CMT3-like isoform X2 [Rhodamnia argentea]|uniref:Cytosine-specific methyltransferase n=1 Tax=Rhodamnia argentea TaxID=178133 RepID=A0ABM3HL91_9MYRT|nr:DNA (cytosine-5)-methyltransferase CMT3-like isoform X2 [Rhodamnia argentea]